MNRIRTFLRSFLGLRGKLTLTYTVVTVSAMLAIEVLGLAGLLLLNSWFGAPEQSYFDDVIYVLYPRAAPYLETDPPDIEGLQQWVDSTYDAGYASAAPVGWADSPAAPIAEDKPFYVLSLDGTIMAAAPESARDDIGQPYALPNVEGSRYMMEIARDGWLSVSGLYEQAPDGSYYVVVPVLHRETLEPLGMITLYVEPPPPWLVTFGPEILMAILLTAIVLTVAVVPFGALFGFIMSRGLTRRLKSLALAADAWSRGDFGVRPSAEGRDELGDLQERLVYMANQLQGTLETQQELVGLQERNRLARELHDTVKQQVFAAAMQMRAARNLAGRDEDGMRRHIEEAEKLLKTSQQDLTMIINEMRPAALENQTLEQALRSHLKMWSQQTTIEGRLRVGGNGRLPAEVERALYRVAQEALANTAKHSQASQAMVDLRTTQDYATLTIADNGAGFDMSQVESQSFGLQSIRQRVEELGGTLTVSSKPGKGTTLWAEIPLRRRLA
jgi:NarL family two-component system sensor histidine kinase LiaS